MKKILFLAISAGFLFTACKSDDDDVYASVVGVWKPSREMAVSGKTEVLFIMILLQAATKKVHLILNRTIQW